MTINVVEAGPHQVSRSAEVQAPASVLFEVVADPHRHGELDGSGTVKDTVNGPHRLADGDKFSVKMKQYGVPYRITSRVTALRNGELVEWRHPAGHSWRWEFEPRTSATTLVTETFDYSKLNPIQASALELFGFPKKNAAGIEATLTKLQEQYAH